MIVFIFAAALLIAWAFVHLAFQWAFASMRRARPRLTIAEQQRARRYAEAERERLYATRFPA